MMSTKIERKIVKEVRQGYSRKSEGQGLHLRDIVEFVNECHRAGISPDTVVKGSLATSYYNVLSGIECKEEVVEK